MESASPQIPETFSALGLLIGQHMADEHREKAVQLLFRLLDLMEAERITDTTHIVMSNKKMDCQKLEIQVLWETLGRIAETCRNHGFIQPLTPHMRLLSHFRREMRAPLPDYEEVRTEVEQRVRQAAGCA